MSDVEIHPLGLLSPEQEHEFKRLTKLIERTNDNLIVFALFRQIEDKERTISAMRKKINILVQDIYLHNSELNPLNVLDNLPKAPRQIVNFTFFGSWERKEATIPSPLEKLVGYLNIQREGFDSQPHVSIFWLKEAGLRKVMLLAPDFWSWRSGSVFDFSSQPSLNSDATSANLQPVSMSYERVPDDELLDYYYQELEKTKQEVGELHSLYARSLDSVARILKDMGRYDEAEPLLRQALGISKTIMGEVHPDYASFLNNLADILYAKGKYEEAELLFRQALKINKITIGEKHPLHAIGLHNLAGVLYQTGRISDAIPLLAQAYTINLKALGEDHPDTRNIAEILVQLQAQS